MLYTIIDINEVLLENSETTTTVQRSVKQQESCCLEGFEEKGHFKIDRIISTNPQDYLNPQYSIGKYL